MTDSITKQIIGAASVQWNHPTPQAAFRDGAEFMLPHIIGFRNWLNKESDKKVDILKKPDHHLLDMYFRSLVK